MDEFDDLWAKIDAGLPKNLQIEEVTRWFTKGLFAAAVWDTVEDRLAYSGLAESPSKVLLSVATHYHIPVEPELPPEALEWARELVRQGYRDEHIVTFTASGYGLEHPIRCRPNLTGCMLNEWLATNLLAPERAPGRYVMTWTSDGPEYVEVENG